MKLSRNMVGIMTVVSMFSTMPVAFAHDDDHDDSDQAFVNQEKQIHRWARNGLISPQEHAAMDAQLESQHQLHDAMQAGWHNGWRHHRWRSNNCQSSWLNQNNPNYSYYQNYNQYWQQHAQEHRALDQAEQRYHQLVADGILTPQEHAILDAQLQAQHAQADSALQNNFNSYGYPYVDQQMPGIINKLRAYFGF